MDTDWLTGKEAARRLHVHPETLRQMHARGDLGDVRVETTPRGHRRYLASDIDRRAAGSDATTRQRRRWSSGMAQYQAGVMLVPVFLLGCIWSVASFALSLFGVIGWSGTAASFLVTFGLLVMIFLALATAMPVKKNAKRDARSHKQSPLK
jgi:cellulose synthase/poly-beta-1,6-N-acetylglucosamine synthase-like glycosyltransferase